MCAHVYVLQLAVAKLLQLRETYPSYRLGQVEVVLERHHGLVLTGNSSAVRVFCVRFGPVGLR